VDISKYPHGSTCYSGFGAIRGDEPISSRLKLIQFVSFNI
jgi:hypothetical protein